MTDLFSHNLFYGGVLLGFVAGFFFYFLIDLLLNLSDRRPGGE